jgi:S-formylglutathione hydrolase FrmB
LQQSEVFYAKLKEKGVDAQFIVKPGGTHPWPTLHEEVKVAADWMHSKLEAASLAKTAP